MAAKLSEVAKETKRDKSIHIQKALGVYPAELAEKQIALDRLHDTSDAVLTPDEMRKALEL